MSSHPHAKPSRTRHICPNSIRSKRSTSRPKWLSSSVSASEASASRSPSRSHSRASEASASRSRSRSHSRASEASASRSRSRLLFSPPHLESVSRIVRQADGAKRAGGGLHDKVVEGERSSPPEWRFSEIGLSFAQPISSKTAVMLSLPPRSFARSMNFCTVACAPSAMIGAMSESRK